MTPSFAIPQIADAARLRVRVKALKPSMRVPQSAIDRLRTERWDGFELDARQAASPGRWSIPKPLPGVVPAGDMAMDAGLPGAEALYSYESVLRTGSISFPGFPLLAELAQRPEYRHISETIAREMTRKWGRIVSTDNDDNTDKIKRLTQLVENHELQHKFREAALHDGLFGRGQIYVDVDGASDDPERLGSILSVTPASIRKGAKLRFKTVQPTWTYPARFNATNALRDDFYVPSEWYVMGRRVNNSRLLTFIGRPLPDLLKAAYAFAGLSLSQMAIPYVQNWLRTRQSVSDFVHSFSIMVLATDMQQALMGGGGDDLFKRVDMFNLFRDNRGTMVINKDSEEFSNVSAQFGALDKLQAQSQEHMASVSGIPLVKLTGITPSGLNASSDGEIRVFYDTIHAAQEVLFGPHIRTVLDVLQLSEFGEIDETLRWEWTPLWQLDEAGKAAVRKTNADIAVELVEASVISPLEARQTLASDPDSNFSNLDVDDLPEPVGGQSDAISDPETNRVEEEADNQGGVTSGV